MAKFGRMMVVLFFLTILTLIIVPGGYVSGQEEIPQQETLGITFITDEEAIRKELESIGVNLDELKNSVQPIPEQEEVPQQKALEITFIAYSGENDQQFRAMAITQTGAKRSVKG